MMFIITFLLSFVIVGVLLSAFKTANYVGEPDRYGKRPLKPGGGLRLAATLILALIIAFASPLSAELINTGNVGLKVNRAGNERGISKTAYVSGLVFYNSWLSSIKELPVTQQHIDYDSTIIITKGGFTATIKPSFNWSVNAVNAADMYQNLKHDVDAGIVQDNWLKNAIIGSVNDVANLYTVDSIFNHRAEFEADIVKEANRRVSKWFTISQLRTNIVPPLAITESINNKTRAVQDAQASIQRTITAEAEAKEKIAKAKGDSAFKVISAMGEARAVQQVQQVLSPTYVDYIKWSKANPDVPRVPSTVLGNSASTLLNLK